MDGLLRHAIATLAYRAGKTLRGAPPEFASFKASPGTRTPAQILAHMGDLIDWALALAEGRREWRDSTPLEWDGEIARFYRALEALDRRLASDGSAVPEEKLFQGAIADALTHTGQMSMLRRMAGCPIRGENYYKAEIVCGRVGPDQAAPVGEFD